MKNKFILSHRGQEPEPSTLYLVGTPIGNLNDISSRALNILKNVSLIACEDTRQTKKIMSKFQISNNLISLNKHNSLTKTPKIIDFIKSGKSIALVSDAGMPGICDPGEDVVKAVKSEGFDVICIPGACAPITALVSSGMPSSSFTFEGFLPKKKIDREKIIQEISKSEKTTIFFESPHRLKKLLKELHEFCGEDREIIVARELTKKYEEHVGNNIKEVMKFFEKKEILGEITIVLKGIDKKINLEFNESELKKEISELMNAGISLSAASKYLSKKKGIKKNLLYNMY
ncbi:16S rRNA (cytidine(1402)-2'-O)-methyltransferase [Prochlorococcus marinus]|uniref:16S rRNA (cytidine(1402)-2'-O)-methyltransferase n=1 Tax=Prochlorococcus marinus TaxID=1219 RepID=UPI001ADBD59E|nr:16S rRNA (cytidine(1402)-2'-O)-methyltransferase [Prochlorococcus marinus]MBO8219507.1 16S rRNA (cytidine(1402)-2'-O)-methyltransferase [Prochlorococcus marinus CUG1416]MBW3051877.1 16S rRNA (cytidine(1402)-2'-O)-methyltransferase [Prochlorococcus marinus str. MU1416]